jgi:hypothetical protein
MTAPRGRDRLTQLLLDRGGLLALVTLVLYIWLAPHHVVDGDNAELATLSVTGGAAHPPGYPLYVLWLRAMSWLPGATPAHTAAIATSILGAITVIVLHAACRAWGARPHAATAAVAIVATGPVMLRVVTVAEVFALNNLVVATVLWLSAARSPLQGWWRAAALGLVAGLGLANHHTCVLVAPVGLLGLWRAARELQSPVRAIGLAVAGLVAGLLPYVYLLVAPETPLSWGHVDDVGRLLAMFFREDYGGPTVLRAGGHDVSAWDSIGALVMTVGRSWLWLPLVAGVAMLVARIAREDGNAAEREPRAGWIALAIAVIAAGPLLVMRFNIPPEGLGLFICQRFHVLPALLLAIPVAQAIDLVPLRRARLTSGLLATAAVITCAALSLSYVGRMHSPAVELSARNMLRGLPPGAVLIHGQDELHVVTGYVQSALGERPDVRIVTWPLMTLPWYRERVASRGIVSSPGAGTPEQRVVASLLASGAPVFVDRLQRDVIDGFTTYPIGILLRVLPSGERAPGALDVFTQNEHLYSAFALDYARPGPDDEYATEVHRRYSYTWELIAKALEAGGYKTQATRAPLHADKLAPR